MTTLKVPLLFNKITKSVITGTINNLFLIYLEIHLLSNNNNTLFSVKQCYKITTEYSDQRDLITHLQRSNISLWLKSPDEVKIIKF